MSYDDLPDDDKPIPKVGPLQEYVMTPTPFGVHVELKKEPPWVYDRVSPADMLREVERRPHSIIPEQDTFLYMMAPHLRDLNYCRCDRCYYERRKLIKELQDIACENR